jgi:DNA mismatch repair protein MutL
MSLPSPSQNRPSRIQILPESVIHKIAAGEVVERPVSVVKELVENAIDAGATRIQVEVEKGGIESIAVTDDGCGISPHEMSLALTRHATSKIRSEQDLFSLHTMGFRGEALPAIASISNFRLESATADSDPVGYVLEVRDGKAGTLKETAMPRGTRVLVKDLFCTTPARLKFLKRPETEWSHIADLLTALALGHLHIEWLLTHNGKKFLFSPPATEPRRRILDTFGKDAMEALYPVNRQVSGIALTGLISHPNFSRKSNQHMFIFVNGRYVQDRLLNHAVVTGYRSLLMTQQYPMVILHLHMDPTLVDVNVHPAKREVKFSNGNAIHHLISETIHQALEAAPWRDTQAKLQTQDHNEIKRLPRPDTAGQMGFEVQAREGIRQAMEDFASRHLPEISVAPAKEAKIGTSSFGSLRLIGQLSSTYLVCESEGSLLLIDQHAAHERIGFEKLKTAYGQGGLPQQALLHPINFDASAAEAERLRTYLPQLEKLNLILEEFGENSFVIKAYPTLLEKCDWQELLRDLVDRMEAESRVGPLEERIDHILATMACHRQIRANHRLTREEMEALLLQLADTPRSYHCPHGRPVMVEIHAREIEKWFKRVL